MKVTMEKEDKRLTAYVEGRVDTTTAPQLDKELKGVIEEIDELILDLDKVEYISSAGLRVILALQKQMEKRDGMIVRHVSEDLMEIFDVTGFTDILTIEGGN